MVDACQGCSICIDNCPSGALSESQDERPYVINKFACSSFRNASGGCSNCMRICPAGQ
ncbi:4Fe-4S dicluster domain-containing protein [Chloroflexota bacterium]